MLIDMHFNATFCMAYAAGFTPEHAQQIATAAQFVDDNSSDGRKEILVQRRLSNLSNRHRPPPYKFKKPE